MCVNGCMSQMHATDSLEFDILDRLAKSLRVSGMKPGDMARALGVHRNTVGNYLNGRTPIDKRTLIAWAFACAPEVTVEWLETGHTPDEPPPGPHGLPETIPDDRTDAIARLAASKRGARRGVTHGYLPIAA